MLEQAVIRAAIVLVVSAAAAAAELPEHVRAFEGGVKNMRVVGTPDPPLPYTVENALPDFPIPRMISFRFEPGTGRMIYVDQEQGQKGTRLRRYDFETNMAETLIANDEFVYGITLHPKFEENGYIFLGSSGPRSGERANWRALVMRYTVPKDGPIDPATGFEILQWPSRGHNGTALAFDEDGLLYMTSGDGTSDSDTDLTGQRLDLFLAKVLRVDVDNPDPGEPYSIPKDNPFLDVPEAQPETYAYGFRNPWRAFWDKNLNKLWVGQNGQDRLEQVYLVEPGANYGWSVYEGSRIFYKERKLGPTPVSPPTFEHGHNESRSLTGGAVYYGDKLADLNDAYIYGDYATGKIWAGKHDGEKVVWHKEIADTQLGLADFVESPDQQLLIANYQTDESGGLYRLIPRKPDETDGKFPLKLSDTGLFTDAAKHEMDSAVIPFSIIVEEWADGAQKQRYLALPPEDPHIIMAGRRGWDTPDGAVLLQTLTLNEKRIETRMLTRNQNEWVGYTYMWNDAQTDAELVAAEGAEKQIGNLTWKFESRASCMICHSRSAGYLIATRTAQLNRDHDYGHGFVANQLDVLNRLGLFRKKGAEPGSPSPMKKEPDQLERHVDPFDPKEDLNERARTYLQTSCAHCHVESGGGNSMIDLRSFAKEEKMMIFNEAPNHGTVGLPEDAKLITPGNAGGSVLFHRISSGAKHRMPPMGQSGPDPRVIPLLAEWIQRLPEIQEEKEE